MKKLCVIIGAGASKYVAGGNSASLSLISKGWQPPLTSELFESRSSFEGVLKHHPQAHGLVAQLKDKLVSSSPNSLEKELSLIYKSNNSEDIRSLKYLSYYFWELFKEISRYYLNGSPSNYDNLIRAIMLREDVEVMFLTLNYDLFLEDSLRKTEIGIAFTNIKEYIPEGKKWRLIGC